MVAIPENKKRTITDKVGKMKVWIYGAPYCGKTYFANSFPDALILSTDGNTEFCDSPNILIRDQVTVNGRMTNTTPAWKFFKEIVDELAKGGNTYKTIVFDLVEDLYELCRIFKYKELGITHESDDPFKAWDKVRAEFMSTMRKAANLDYNIVFISHEDIKTDMTSRKGDNVVAINPNIQPKIANKIAGLVDMTVRAVNENGKRTLLVKPIGITFGGVRVSDVPDEIPMTFKDFETLYNKNRSE